MSYYNSETYKLAPIFKTNNKYSGNYYNLRKQIKEKDIINLMLILNYSDENFAIFAGDENYLRITNYKLFEQDKSRLGRQDDRNNIQYYQDLIAGWLYEDLTKIKIEQQNPNIKVILNGSDSERKVLIDKVTNNVDFKIIYNNKYILAELGMSHSGYCYNNELINLRNNKRKHILEQNAYFLQIETHADIKKFALITPNELSNYINETKWSKDTNAILIKKEKYYSNDKLSEVLIDVIEQYGTNMN